MTDQIPREQALMDEFKEALEKDGPVVLAQRVATLENELTQTGDALKLAVERADAAEADRDQALELAARAEKDREEAAAGEKKAKAEVTKLKSPAKPRKLGEVEGVDGTALPDAIDKADQVEIAFSDGKREVGIPPIAVTGSAWKPHSRGFMLAHDVNIEGPQTGSSISIDGYALILDGKQVAYSQRSMPLQVAPGQKITITDDIIF